MKRQLTVQRMASEQARLVPSSQTCETAKGWEGAVQKACLERICSRFNSDASTSDDSGDLMELQAVAPHREDHGQPPAVSLELWAPHLPNRPAACFAGSPAFKGVPTILDLSVVSFYTTKHGTLMPPASFQQRTERKTALESRLGYH